MVSGNDFEEERLVDDPEDDNNWKEKKWFEEWVVSALVRTWSPSITHNPRGRQFSFGASAPFYISNFIFNYYIKERMKQNKEKKRKLK